jgi:cell division protein FtsB
MTPRFIPFALIVLLVVLHGQLWFGRGSIPSVSKMQGQLTAQKSKNAQASVANDRLSAEIADLKGGLEIIEERARAELGMVRNNEIFVQIAK